MNNTIPASVPRTMLPEHRPGQRDPATRETPASGANGSTGVVNHAGSSREDGPDTAKAGAPGRSHEAIRKAIADEIAAAVAETDRSGIRVNTEVHESTGRYIVKVIEGESGNVIREFPPADYLDVVAALDELGGLLLQGKI